MNFFIKAPNNIEDSGEYILDYTVYGGTYTQNCDTLQEALEYAFRLLDESQGNPISIGCSGEIAKTQDEILTLYYAR